MFKTYLYTNGEKLFRGRYKTLDRAKGYGKKDLDRYREILTVLGKQGKPQKMIIEDSNGNEIYIFEEA